MGLSHIVKLQLQRITPVDRSMQFLDYVGAESGVGNTKCKDCTDEEIFWIQQKEENGDVGQLKQQIIYTCIWNSYVCPYVYTYIHVHMYTNMHVYLIGDCGIWLYWNIYLLNCDLPRLIVELIYIQLQVHQNRLEIDRRGSLGGYLHMCPVIGFPDEDIKSWSDMCEIFYLVTRRARTFSPTLILPSAPTLPHTKVSFKTHNIHMHN